VQAFYFGTSEQPLLGVYHEPHRTPRREVSVLLCPPFGHEYVRAHRALRNLAELVSVAGYAAFRFDYSGTGDSGGTDAVGVAQWLRDIALAVDEVKETSGRPRVILVGLRLGAMLAALVAEASRSDIERLVLWDPVVVGAAHLSALERMHDRWLMALPRDGDRRAGDPPELFGFPLPPAAGQIADLDLMAMEWPSNLPIHLFDSEDHAGGQELSGRLSARGVPHTWQRVADRVGWDRPEAAQVALLPHAMVQAIAALLGGLP
jgi:pimeloyl-ACP methyl ester carboxylesterase